MRNIVLTQPTSVGCKQLPKSLSRKGSWIPSALFDHLVGAQQDRGWDRKTQRLGGLEVDEESEQTGVLTRQVTRFSPLENLINIDTRAAENRGDVWPI